MRGPLSVVINALNEAESISRAINSVKTLASEVIVVDMESDDGTADVAKKLGAKVFKHKRLSYVEPARNFGISKASQDWVLILDPDEEIPGSLLKEIEKALENPQADYYRIPRKNIVFNKWLKHSRWWPDYNIRLFRVGSVSWNEVIHAVPITEGKGADLEAKENLAIIHHHYDSVDQYLSRMNRYSTVQASLKVKEGYEFTPLDILDKPVREFLSRYFFGQGYKDGLHGLAVSLLQAFSELVLYLKIWQAGKFPEKSLPLNEVITKMADQEKDLHYWQNDALYKETGSLGARIKRKLRI